VEQANPHRALEVTNLQAQRRLADAHAFRGATEILFSGNREKIPDVAQFHGY
jgi:hypothetical protein